MPPERSQEELETRHEQVSFLHIGISTSNRRERNYWSAIFQCLKRKQEVCIIYIIWVASTEIWRFFWSWCLHQPSNVLVLCILNIFANMFQNRNQGFTYTACSARHLHIGNLWMNLLPSIQLVEKAGGIFPWQQGTARAGRTWCQACGTSHRNSVLAERSLTSRERSHIPPWKKENHRLKSTKRDIGYVSFQEPFPFWPFQVLIWLRFCWSRIKNINIGIESHGVKRWILRNIFSCHAEK